ncbi:MAG: endonuclease/exonuclease/phosphatase family protein [candidate division Zixibacteria bacterium]|nr:endonuclease/exonuclease/phosphatase family protein [candidate division Zixibacteria bacterium]
MKIALLIVGILMIVATILPTVRTNAWWIRVFDFPRGQIALITLACLVVYLWHFDNFSLLENLFIAGLGLTVFFQSMSMYPYTLLSKVQVQKCVISPGLSTISLLVANVLMNNRNTEQLLSIIQEKNPDLVLTLETNQWWQERLKFLDESYPYSVSHLLDNFYGMFLQSRLELINPTVEFLIEKNVPSIHSIVRLSSGEHIELHCLHPKPPSPTENDTSTERDAELLIVAKSVKSSRLPIIVAGDLNDVAWSHSTALFQKISGLLDPRIGRGFFNTFSANIPFFRWPLDHVFHSDHFKLVEIERLAKLGSDHFPMFIKLNYEPTAIQKHTAPTADHEDHKEANEQIEKAARKTGQPVIVLQPIRPK